MDGTDERKGTSLIDTGEDEPIEAGGAEDTRFEARDAVQRMAEDPPVADREGELKPEDAKQVMEASEWLLQSFDQEQVAVHRLTLDVGAPTHPIEIPWTIKSVDGAELRRIRARGADSLTGKQARAKGAIADADAAYRANLAVVVAGTYDPDLKTVAEMRGLADPTMLIEEAFKNKQGLVDQVAGEIMSLSGYDDEAVRDAVEVKATGNS